MLEEIGWFILWVLLLYLVHLQFRICIPVTLACMKVAESCVLLLLIKLMVFFYVYGDGISVDAIKNSTLTLVSHAKQYAGKFDL